MTADNYHLANKYRPTRFSEVIGQDVVVGSLRGAIIRGRIPPAILLHGPRSTGKTTLARLFAFYVNCTSPDKNSAEPCGKCPSCEASKRVIAGIGTHPDVSEMNAALHGGIDRIRDLDSLAPQAPRYRYRIFILDEAHQITSSAFNGALKLLEDPPRRSKFIFCTTNPEKLPETIQSRCQVFKLAPLDTKVVAKRVYDVALQENFKPSDLKKFKSVCMRIADASGGHLREALGLLDNVISYVVANKTDDVDVDTLLHRIVQKAPELSPYIYAQKYMQAIFAEDMVEALHMVNTSPNHEYFLKFVLQSLSLIVSSWVDRDILFDKSKFWMLKGVKYPSEKFGRDIIMSCNDIETLLELYTNAYERTKLYSTDTTLLLQQITIRVVKMLSSWKKG